MFKPINGYTKAKIKEVLEKEFKGKAWLPSASSTGSCKYLMNDGRKCAVGCFLPAPKTETERNALLACNLSASALTMPDNFPEYAPYMPLDAIALGMLQTFHDCRMSPGASPEKQKAELLAWVDQNVAGAS